MKKHTHHISVIVLLMLVLSMLVSACTGGDHSESEPETGREIVITSGQLESEPFISTAETTIAVTDADVITTTGVLATTTTTAPLMTTTAPITSTAVLTTTAVPVTTTAPITTTQPTITTVPVTPPNRPVTTTKVPVTAAPHTHSYGPWTTTKAATCTATGIQIRTCSCGASETKTISAIGHNWSPWTVTKAATESAKGEEVRSCSVCGKKETRSIDKLAHTHSYGEWTLCDDYIHESRSCSCGKTETQTHYATPEDARLIADRVIYYVNKYRAEEGNVIATKLDRLTLVAEMRSEQLTTNFAHDTEDMKEASTYYQYGEKVANGRYDFETGKIIYDGTYFYQDPGKEAIGKGYGKTIDTAAYNLASGVHESSEHWRYVGAVDDNYKDFADCKMKLHYPMG